MVAEVKGPAGHDYSELAALLRQFEGETLVFVPNPGNAGDALINLGMFALFDDLGVSWEIGKFNETYPDRIVVFSGGGAIVDVYPDADRFFLRNHPVCKALILLPHTVRAYPELIAGMDARCHLFARERPSHAFLTTHATGGAHVYQSHDMAFYLSDARIAGMAIDQGFLGQPGIRSSWARMLIKILIGGRLKSSTLNVIRDDVEATGERVPSPNFDLSTMFASGHLQAVGMHMTPGVCATTAKALRLVVRAFPRVRTNRLHVAILCAIAGRTVTMMDNSYGKNRSIYEHSIANHYPNVTFHSA